MARSDVQIDLATNDLKIEKSKSNVYAGNSWRYDSALDVVIVSIQIPREYSDGLDNDKDWKAYTPSTNNLQKIDVIYVSKLVELEYTYISIDGLTFVISKESLGNYSDEYGYAPNFLTVEDYNLIIEEADLVEDDYVFGYASQDSSAYFIINRGVLGDFVVEDNISQNEYILLNASEGSFHQVPLQGVGIGNYIQSPTSDQQLIDMVVEKFAVDTLRVLGIVKNGDNITIETEDFNR
jgi:hypothetical protein